VLIVVAIVVAVALYMRARAGAASESDSPPSTRGLAEVDFKVEGATAHVYFDTQIPDAGPDDVLMSLMGREAMRIFKDKAGHLPLAEVKHVTARGTQAGQPVTVTTVAVTAPVEMDRLDAPTEDDVVLAGDVSAAGHDPLGALHDMELGRGDGYRASGDELPPLSQELNIPAKVIEAVAGPGGTLLGMRLEDFITGLLRASGYSVVEAADGTKLATKGGTTSYLEFVEHVPGSHPELDERSIDGFIMKFMGSHASRAMLFTAKYGPYAIYEKERRNDKVKFMTRERLQAFVDSVAMV
jgi:hypothetical protein